MKVPVFNCNTTLKLSNTPLTETKFLKELITLELRGYEEANYLFFINGKELARFIKTLTELAQSFHLAISQESESHLPPQV